MTRRPADRSRGAARALRVGLRLALGLGLIVSAPAPSGAADAGEDAAPTRPNILLLVAEDMSPRVGAFGDPVARTPSLDRLAQAGVRYPNTFTTAGVCAPSRAALILGLHQTATGSQHMRTSSRPDGAYLAVPPPEAKAFPERLRAAGYFTYQHGKLDYQFSGPLSKSGPSTIWDAEDDERQWADRAPGQPFFGMVNSLVTHESGLFEPLGSVWPRSGFHFVMQLVQAYQRWGSSDLVVETEPADVVLPPYYPDLPEIRQDLARQYDNIQIMDARVGELLDRLERDGLAESTIVIWTTDHGDGLPRAKRELYDSGLRVPMIIRWPDGLRPEGLSPGDVDERLISFVDLAATILGMAGVERPADLHGRDFLARDARERLYVFAARDRIDEQVDRQRAIRDRRYKLIVSDFPELPGGHASEFRENLPSVRAWRRAWQTGALDAHERRWFEPNGRERFFDLVHDPHELNDLSESPEHQVPLARLRAALADWRERVDVWRDVPEAEMVERFWPGGEQPVTDAPRFAIVDGRIEAVCATPGASIEVRVGDGPWRVFSRPFVAPAGAELRARAVRYGWAPSPEILSLAP